MNEAMNVVYKNVAVFHFVFFLFKSYSWDEKNRSMLRYEKRTSNIVNV